MARRTIEERFMDFVCPEPNTGCWLWMGSGSKSGYGHFSPARKSMRAHRWAYEHFIGPIPDGLVIDHKCRVRGCVNPDHLRVVTIRENSIIGEGPTALNYRKTHCKRGHELSGNNLLPTKFPTWRVCRRCKELANLLRWKKNQVPEILAEFNHEH